MNIISVYPNGYILVYALPSLNVGTGKSVTGAHLAFALAVKLKSERASISNNDARPSSAASRRGVQIEARRPCVMYCGPSNQAVNVVLGEYCIYSCIRHTDRTYTSSMSSLVPLNAWVGGKHNQCHDFKACTIKLQNTCSCGCTCMQKVNLSRTERDV